MRQLKDQPKQEDLKGAKGPQPPVEPKNKNPEPPKAEPTKVEQPKEQPKLKEVDPPKQEQLQKHPPDLSQAQAPRDFYKSGEKPEAKYVPGEVNKKPQSPKESRKNKEVDSTKETNISDKPSKEEREFPQTKSEKQSFEETKKVYSSDRQNYFNEAKIEKRELNKDPETREIKTDNIGESQKQDIKGSQQSLPAEQPTERRANESTPKAEFIRDKEIDPSTKQAYSKPASLKDPESVIAKSEVRSDQPLSKVEVGSNKQNEIPFKSSEKMEPKKESQPELKPSVGNSQPSERILEPPKTKDTVNYTQESKPVVITFQPTEKRSEAPKIDVVVTSTSESKSIVVPSPRVEISNKSTDSPTTKKEILSPSPVPLKEKPTEGIVTSKQSESTVSKREPVKDIIGSLKSEVKIRPVNPEIVVRLTTQLVERFPPTAPPPRVERQAVLMRKRQEIFKDKIVPPKRVPIQENRLRELVAAVREVSIQRNVVRTKFGIEAKKELLKDNTSLLRKLRAEEKKESVLFKPFQELERLVVRYSPPLAVKTGAQKMVEKLVENRKAPEIMIKVFETATAISTSAERLLQKLKDPSLEKLIPPETLSKLQGLIQELIRTSLPLGTDPEGLSTERLQSLKSKIEELIAKMREELLNLDLESDDLSELIDVLESINELEALEELLLEELILLEDPRTFDEVLDQENVVLLPEEKEGEIEEVFTLEGYVIDSKTELGIQGIEVFGGLLGREITNNEGHFAFLNIPKDTYVTIGLDPELGKCEPEIFSVTVSSNEMIRFIITK